jgi:pyruvate dehydrogenase E1 component alpha subunit
MNERIGPDKATLLDIYRRTTLIKQNDALLISTIKSGKIVANYYSARGQEIIPAAVSVNLTDEDYICTIYRGVHDMLAKGVPLKELWAELAGKATGTCKGKGGTMHITHPQSGIMVTTGVVGSSMPIANGLAWASQLHGNKRVTIAYFGDGASNIGAFHESLNLAALWKLPVIFVCQNNQYSEHTRYEKVTAARQIADRGVAYQMPAVRVNGNEPAEIYQAAHDAVAAARAGEGPTLIEAMTFRFNGHVLGDADRYMDKAEKKAAMDADPVVRFRARLIADNLATEAELGAMEAEIDRQLREARDFALESPLPDVAELGRDIYAEEFV